MRDMTAGTEDVLKNFGSLAGINLDNSLVNATFADDTWTWGNGNKLAIVDGVMQLILA